MVTLAIVHLTTVNLSLLFSTFEGSSSMNKVLLLSVTLRMGVIVAGVLNAEQDRFNFTFTQSRIKLKFKVHSHK